MNLWEGLETWHVILQEQRIRGIETVQYCRAQMVLEFSGSQKVWGLNPFLSPQRGEMGQTTMLSDHDQNLV